MDNPSHLLIRIRPSGGGAGANLEVETQLDGAIYAASPVALDLARLWAQLRSANNAYGKAIGAALLEAPCVEYAVSALKGSPFARVQFMLEGQGPHHAVWWERTQFSGLDRLAVNSHSPFSRFAAFNRPLEDSAADVCFHLLFAVASPDGLPQIAVERQVQSQIDSCRPLIDSGQMRLSIVAGRSGLPDSIRAQESRGKIDVIDGACTIDLLAALLQSVHGLHIIAHGAFQSNQFFLRLEGEDPTPGAEFIERLASTGLRLVFLESCQSAVAGADSGVGGFLNDLVAAGIPAAIGMQDLVLMQDSEQFRKGFYNSLILDGVVDTAANAGRFLLVNSVNYAWAIPVLATRLRSGRLWHESPLRTASRQLYEYFDRKQEDSDYRPLPIDVIACPVAELNKNSRPDAGDNIVDAPKDRRRQDVYEALSGALAAKDSVPVCLIGPPGRNKSRILETVFLSECKRYWDGSQDAIPLMLSLPDCANSSFDPETTVARAISKFLEASGCAALRTKDILDALRRGQRFAFFITGSSDLSRAAVTSAIRCWTQLFNRYQGAASHRYVFTFEQSSLSLDGLPDDARCLFIQPMAIERVRTYLEGFPLGQELNQRLRQSRVFDLIEVPWLLAEMLGQLKRNVMANTRADIITRIVTERLMRLTGSSSMSTGAAGVMHEIGWRMQSARAQDLPGVEVFSLLAMLRGNRDYSLVNFRDELIHCQVLGPAGSDGLRFAYNGFRTYACARFLLSQPDDARLRQLEDITAQLGRKARADWWSEPLFLLAGMWKETDTLLRMILSGSPLREGDQLCIAARCLQEARLAFPGTRVDDALVRSILNGLIQASHPLNQRSVASRQRVLEFLGPLISVDPDGPKTEEERPETSAVRHLLSLLLEKIRPDDKGHLQYDYSGIRLAAVQALLYAPDETAVWLRRHPVWSQRQQLMAVLGAWLASRQDQLIFALESDDDELASTAAAFALALMHRRDAFGAMQGRFEAADSSPDLLWALADSMVEVGSPAIHDFLVQQMARTDRAPQVLYMIGRVAEARDRELVDFVRKQVDSDDSTLAGHALVAWSRFEDADSRARCYQWLTAPNPEPRDFERRYYALQALRSVGDESSLRVLEQLRFESDSGVLPANFLFVQQLRNEVYEEIYWRLAGGMSREVMMPIGSRPRASAAAT